MHKYEELEKKYYAQKRKSYLKLFLLLILFISVLFYLYFIPTKEEVKQPVVVVKNSNKSEIVKKEENITKEKTVVKEKIIVKKTVKKEEEKNITKAVLKKDNALFLPVVPKIEVKKEYKLTLAPIYPNIDKIEKKVVHQKRVEVKKVEVKKIETPKKIVHKEEPKNGLKSKEINLMVLINNFENKKSYKGAIKIAQILYNKGDFQKAIDWAFKANSINPSDYESWLIYAKSLYKMNRKTKAKKVVSGYIENYGPNDKIENFLENIK
jgi:tetratricopeptide (TPR) repeat protein